ncbi:MAG: low-density lipoprotein receptor class A repeat-containing protein [Candidatus Poseidoniales archaeon]
MEDSRLSPSLILTALLLIAIIPIGTVGAAPTEASEFYYGVEYDWNSIDTDLENLTGLNVPEILGEVMGAADDAGFNLIVGQLQTGASNVYVHHTEDISAQTIQDNNGNDVSVWSRTDDVTLRHGILADSILQTNWSETTFGADPSSFDIDIVQSLEQVLTVDMTYTEYLDDSYNLVGADMAFSMEMSAAIGLDIDALFEGGGEDFPVDFNSELTMGYSITDSTSEWRLGSPDSIYVDLSAEDEVYWDCDDCGNVIGSYTGAVEYSFSVSGIPTEDFGLDAGEFDLEISDSLTESGTFDIEAEGEYDFQMGDTMTVDIGDGNGVTTQVQSCESCPPGNPLMFMMMAHVLVGSGEAFAEQIGEDLGEDLIDGIEGVFGDDDGDSGDNSEYNPNEGMWMCDNGEYIYEWSVNDGYEDCYDGSDEMDMHGSTNLWSDNISMSVTLDEELLSFAEEDEMGNTVYFTCDDGTEISWDWVNDWEDDCSNGEDEDDSTSTKMFTCNDGSQIDWTAINDYEADCPTAEDEGASGHYTVEAVLFDAEGTPLSQHQQTFCDAYGCDQDTDWFYGSMNFETGTPAPTNYGSHEFCVSGSVTDTASGAVVMEFSSMCEDSWTGPSVYDYIELETGNMNVDFRVIAYDYSEDGNVTMTITILDPNQNQVYLDTFAIDGSQSSWEMVGDVSVLEVGEYCMYMEMVETGQTEAYESQTDCFMVEEEPEPSDSVMAIVEAFADSSLPDVLEQFGMNLEERLETIEPFEEFPYNDGMWAPLWSNEHAAMVGVGVYVMNDDGNYTMAGPVTEGYTDDAPAKVSIRYLTGVAANAATNGMEQATSMADIVDVEEHNLDDIAEDLAEAGIDISDIELPQSSTTDDGDGNEAPPTVDEVVDGDGLLPFISPLSVIAIIALAGVVAGSRREEEC